VYVHILYICTIRSFEYKIVLFQKENIELEIDNGKYSKWYVTRKLYNAGNEPAYNFKYRLVPTKLHIQMPNKAYINSGLSHKLFSGVVPYSRYRDNPVDLIGFEPGSSFLTQRQQVVL